MIYNTANFTDPTIPIFCFGSNKEGRHRRGAAKTALEKWGAKMWKGVGLYGQSYAIPTKRTWDVTLPLVEIEEYVREFVQFARDHPQYEFLVTKIGCGLANLGDMEDTISSWFIGAPSNCYFDPTWKKYGLPSWRQAPNEIRP